MNRRQGASIAICLFVLVARAGLGCAGNPEEIDAPPETVLDAGIDTHSEPSETSVTVEAAVDSSESARTCSVDGWCYTTLPDADSFDAGDVVPTGNALLFSLSSVWIAPDRQAWAVSVGGHVLHWNGSSWKVVFVTTGRFRSVWGASATDIWIGGDSGLLLHGKGSSPDALTFEPVAIGTTRTISRVWGTSSSDIWVLANGAFHLTADTVSAPSPFTPVTIPSSFGDGAGVTSLILASVWGTASETWFAGTERASCAPPDCMNVSEPVAARRSIDSGGVETWDHVPMPIEDAAKVVGGVSTADGLQVLTIQTAFESTAFVARIADDASKLDPGRGAITVVGSHAWNFEIAEDYGQPTGISGQQSNDVWLVGNYGVVRHFDGDDWQISQVALTRYLPLVNHLLAIDTLVEPSGDRDMWIVGDGVALHRTVQP